MRTSKALLTAGLAGMMTVSTLFAATAAHEGRTPAHAHLQATGHPNASGYARVFTPAVPEGATSEEAAAIARTVCIELDLDRVGAGSVTGVHVHERDGGAVAVAFDLNKQGKELYGCGTAESGPIAADIVLPGRRAEAKAYYVNVHTDSFPGSAVEGDIVAPH